MDIVRVKSMIVEVDNGCYTEEQEIEVKDMIGIIKGNYYLSDDKKFPFEDITVIKGSDDMALMLYRMVNKGEF